MVCTAPTSRYSLHCRICFPRLRGYFKPRRSSICAPLITRYYLRRSSHLSAYASTLFGWVSYACRVAFATVDFAHCAALRSRFSCQRASESKFAMMEINANKSTPQQPQPRFYWRFHAFTKFSRDAFSPKIADGAVLRSERRTDGRTHERTRNARQRTRAHANAPTHAPTHAHAHPCARTPAHTRVTHARTRTHTHARGPPPTASEPNGNGRHFCARSKCKAIEASASV